MIITIYPGNNIVQRVLVNSEASRNILYYEAFKRMNYTEENLVPYSGLLEGFTNHTVKVRGTIVLEVEIGEDSFVRSENVEFMVIDLVSPYNAIVGIPFMLSFEMVVSIPHQRVKYPTPNGIGCLKSEVITVMSKKKEMQKAKVISTSSMTIKSASHQLRINVVEAVEDEVDWEVTESMLNNTTMVVAAASEAPVNLEIEIVKEVWEAKVVDVREPEGKVRDQEVAGENGFTMKVVNVTPNMSYAWMVRFVQMAEPRIEEIVEKVVDDSEEDCETFEVEDSEGQPIGNVFADPRKVVITWGKKRKTMEVETLQTRDEPDIQAGEELEEVEINSYFPEQKIKIGKQLSRDERDCLVEFLKENLDVFAW